MAANSENPLEVMGREYTLQNILPLGGIEPLELNAQRYHRSQEC